MSNIGRKLYHILGGLVLVGLYAWLGRTAGLWTLFGILIFATAMDIARLAIPGINRFYYRRFPRFIRESERYTLTGTPWYILGILLALYFYEFPVAVYAISFLACGDVAATTVGERWGSIKLFGGKKSLQGTIAFLLVSMLAGAVIDIRFLPLSPAIWVTGAVVSAIMEIVPVGVNDNLSIPLVAGFLMQVLVNLGL